MAQQIGWNWRTIGVTPIGDGWKAAYIDGDDVIYELVPALLTQIFSPYEVATLQDVPLDDDRIIFSHPEHRVIAGTFDGGYLVPVDDCGNFWRVFGPGEPEPDEDQIAEAREDYKRRASLQESCRAKEATP